MEDPLLPNEPHLSELALRNRLAAINNHKTMHTNTLHKAINRLGLPSRPNPFGRGLIFYWSEIQEWLDSLKGKAEDKSRMPPKRGPGRPRKVVGL